MYAVRRFLAKCPFTEQVWSRSFKVERHSLVPSAHRRGRWSEVGNLTSKDSMKRISDMFSSTQLNLDRYFSMKAKPWHACKKVAPCEGLPPKKERGKEAQTACCVFGPCKGLNPKAKSVKKKPKCSREYCTNSTETNRESCEKGSMTCDDKSFQIVQPKVSSRSVSTGTRCSKGCGENYHLFSVRTRGKDKGITVKGAPSLLESCGGVFLRKHFTTQSTCTRDIYHFSKTWRNSDDLKTVTTQVSPLSSRNFLSYDLKKVGSSKTVKPRNNKSKEGKVIQNSRFSSGGTIMKPGPKKEDMSVKKSCRIVPEKIRRCPNRRASSLQLPPLPPLPHISYIPQTGATYSKSFLYKNKRSVLP